MNVAVPMEGLATADVRNDEDAVSGSARMTTGNQVSWKHMSVLRS